VAKTKQSPADELAALPPTRRTGWWLDLEPRAYKQLQEVRDRFRNGGYAHHKKSYVSEWVHRKFNLPESVAHQTVLRWLEKSV